MGKLKLTATGSYNRPKPSQPNDEQMYGGAVDSQ